MIGTRDSKRRLCLFYNVVASTVCLRVTNAPFARARCEYEHEESDPTLTSGDGCVRRFANFPAIFCF